MYQTCELLHSVLRKLPDGRWGIAKPLGISLWQRIKDAWAVLSGKAAAVRWY